MACGLPVIACDVSGVREVVVHNETGWLCQTDPDSIREGIETLLGNPELRMRLGSAARSFSVENFSLDRVVKREIQLYEELTNKSIC
jgi:glycosyltransferase involved in cell wall biosynthesis